MQLRLFAVRAFKFDVDFVVVESERPVSAFRRARGFAVPPPFELMQPAKLARQDRGGKEASDLTALAMPSIKSVVGKISALQSAGHRHDDVGFGNTKMICE